MLRQLFMTLKFYQVVPSLLKFNSNFYASALFHLFFTLSPSSKNSANFQTITLPNLSDSTFTTFPYVLPEWLITNTNPFTNQHIYPYGNLDTSRMRDAFEYLQDVDKASLITLLKDYRIFKYSKCATENPTNQTNAFYQWVVRYNLSASQVQCILIDCDDTVYPVKPPSLWSQSRVGQSRTQLTDGRVVLIGGEHNCPLNYLIYSDVCIIDLNDDIEVYNYPLNTFRCPEQHSATLVVASALKGTDAKSADEQIIIIGSQSDHTSVYRLDTQNFKIEQLVTRNSMGWIQGHNATFKNHQIIISGGEVHIEDTLLFVDNIDSWALNLKTLIWKNLTNNHRHWQHFYVIRQDYDSIHLQDYHALDCYLKMDEKEVAADQAALLKNHCNIIPDIDSYRQLFCPPIDHEIVMDSDATEDVVVYSEDIIFDDYENHLIYINGIKIKYEAKLFHIEVIIEGKLSADKLELLQQNLRHKLSKIENMACEVIEI